MFAPSLKKREASVKHSVALATLSHTLMVILTLFLLIRTEYRVSRWMGDTDQPCQSSPASQQAKQDIGQTSACDGFFIFQSFKSSIYNIVVSIFFSIIPI